MDGRQSQQFGFGQGGQGDAYTPPIVGIHRACKHAHANQSADELNGAMVFDAEFCGQFAHGKGLRPAAFYGEQGLVLLRRQPLPVSLGFAENGEAPQGVAELGKGGEISRLQFPRFDIGPLDS